MTTTDEQIEKVVTGVMTKAALGLNERGEMFPHSVLMKEGVVLAEVICEWDSPEKQQFTFRTLAQLYSALGADALAVVGEIGFREIAERPAVLNEEDLQFDLSSRSALLGSAYSAHGPHPYVFLLPYRINDDGTARFEELGHRMPFDQLINPSTPLNYVKEMNKRPRRWKAYYAIHRLTKHDHLVNVIL